MIEKSLYHGASEKIGTRKGRAKSKSNVCNDVIWCGKGKYSDNDIDELFECEQACSQSLFSDVTDKTLNR